MSNWFDFAIATVLVLLVVVVAIAFGYRWAEHRTPGAITLGSRVDIKDRGIIVGRMVLTEFTQHLNEPTTATLTDASAFIKARTIPPDTIPDGTASDHGGTTQWSWDR